jgi:DNA polymerase
VDARDRLRRYLEQRRETGERELQLDGMSVDDVLSVVSATGALKRRARPAPGAELPEPPPRPELPAEPTEAPRGSALPSAFAPVPGEVDEDEAESDEQDSSGDHGAPADHPRLRGGGAPAGGAEVRPAPAGPDATNRAPAPGGPGEDAGGGDWRAALRASGGSPEAGTVPTPSPATPMVTRPSATPAARVYRSGTPFPGLEDVTTGVVFDGAAAPGLLDDDGIEALPDLAALAARVQACTRCALYKTATHGVPGEGNPEADFVVVGEAPGADEDASGRPFVGASGQLLTKILAAISLAREDVFICNVVKHRPPGNRNPAPDEVAACSPYLIRQLELVRPKVILTVGNFAAQTLLNTKLGIGKLRGQVHLYRGVPLVATYHPAALLRNPAWKRPTWEDVQLARRLLDRAPPG